MLYTVYKLKIENEIIQISFVISLKAIKIQCPLEIPNSHYTGQFWLSTQTNIDMLM